MVTLVVGQRRTKTYHFYAISMTCLCFVTIVCTKCNIMSKSKQTTPMHPPFISSPFLFTPFSLLTSHFLPPIVHIWFFSHCSFHMLYLTACMDIIGACGTDQSYNIMTIVRVKLLKLMVVLLYDRKLALFQLFIKGK